MLFISSYIIFLIIRNGGGEVHSQSILVTEDLLIGTESTSNPNVNIIHENLPVTIIEPGGDECFTVDFQSDGISGYSFTSEDEARFKLDNSGFNPETFSQNEINEALRNDNNNNGLTPIKIPTEFCIKEEGTNYSGTRKLAYKSVPKLNAPADYICNADNAIDLDNCIYARTTSSLLYNYGQHVSPIEGSDFIIDDGETPEIIVNSNSNAGIAATFAAFLSQANDTNIQITNGVGNQNITSVGSGSLTADGEIKASLGSDPSNPVNKRYEAPIIFEIPFLGNDSNVEQSSTFLSRLVKSSNPTIEDFKSVPFIESTTGTLLPPETNSFLGIGKIENPAAPQPERSLQDYLNQAIVNSVESNLRTTKRIGTHSPIRALNDSQNIEITYDFCEAVNASSTYAPIDLSGISLNSGSINNISNADLRCLSALQIYHDINDISGTEIEVCVQNLADGGTCELFTVEEDSLSFLFANGSLPVNQQAILESTTLIALEDKVDDPYPNPFSLYTCATFNVSYGVSNENVSYVKNVRSLGDNANQSKYCVVGALWSNASWLFSNTVSNKLNQDNEAGYIRMPRETLTCDKKEEARFGAEMKWTDVITARTNSGQYPDIPLDYSDANLGTFASEELGLEGSTNNDALIKLSSSQLPYTFNEAFAEIKPFPLQNNQIRIINTNSPLNGGPRLALFGTINNRDRRDPTEQPKYPSYLCLADDHESYLSIKQDADGNITETNKCVQVSPDQRFTGYGSCTVSSGDSGEIEYHCAFIEPDENPLRIRQSSDTNPMTMIRLIHINPIQDTLEQKKIPINPREDTSLSDNYKINDVRIYQNGENLRLCSALVGYANNGANSDLNLSYDARVVCFNITEYAENQLFGDDSLQFSLSPNLCQDVNISYCNRIGANGTVTMLLPQNAQENTLASYIVGNGMGMIIPLGNLANLSSTSSPPLASIFGYVQGNEPAALSTFDDDRPTIATHVIQNKGCSFIFLNNGTLIKLCGSSFELNGCTNCLDTEQYTIDYSTFKSDYSDPLGTGVMGIQAEPLGYPIVKYAEVNNFQQEELTRGLENIYACYEYEGIRKAVICGEISLMYTPLLSVVENENLIPTESSEPNIEEADERSDDATQINVEEGSGLSEVIGREFSNRYIFPSNSETDFLRPITYKDQRGNDEPILSGTKKLTVFDDGTPTGVIRIDLNNEYWKPRKAKCEDKLNNRLIDDDSHLDNTGGTLLNAKQSSEGYSSINSGQYCEQTWCFEGDPKLIFNEADFGNDAKDAQLISAIEKYVGSNKSQQINQICKKSDEYGIPCELLIAIWKVESQFATTGIAFGCLGQGDSGFEAQLNCAITKSLACGEGSCGIQYANWEAKRTDVVLSGPSSTKTSVNYDGTGGNADNGGDIRGQCQPPTELSYIAQRYTPNDRRIDIENQCNQGVASRKDYSKYCADGTARHEKYNTFTSLSAFRANGFITPYVWPHDGLLEEGKHRFHGEMWNWRQTFEKIDEVYQNLTNGESRLPITNQCYPTGDIVETSIGTNSKSLQELQEEVKQSFNIDKETEGVFAMNLAAWGNGAAAGYVNMVLQGIETSTESNRGNSLLGIHEVKPGEEFSFLEKTGFPNGNDVVRAQSDPRFTEFNFQDGSTILGGGWCELSTTMFMAACNSSAIDCNITNRVIVSGESEPKYGDGTSTNSGYVDARGHSGVTASGFNNSLKVQDDNNFNGKSDSGDSITDDQYIAVFSPGLDFKIVNQDDDNRSIIVAITIDPNEQIYVYVAFGTPLNTALQHEIKLLPHTSYLFADYRRQSYS